MHGDYKMDDLNHQLYNNRRLIAGGIYLVVVALVAVVLLHFIWKADTDQGSATAITITASGKVEVPSDQHVVSGYLHFYEEDGVAAMSAADRDMEQIEAVISELVGDHSLFDVTDSFNNWGGEDCIKCGKKFYYTAERGFSVRCPDWETMVALQHRLKEEFPAHNFRANSLPSDRDQVIGNAVNQAIESAKKQAQLALGEDVVLIDVCVIESSINPDVNFNFASAKVEAVFVTA